MELYSYEKYKGYCLFVEVIDVDEDYYIYEGVAQLNGTTVFSSKSVISGDKAEQHLMSQIDLEEDHELLEG